MSSNSQDIFEDTSNKEDLFGDATSEVSLSDNTEAAPQAPKPPPVRAIAVAQSSPKSTDLLPKEKDPEIVISVIDPEKVGDGMSSYMVYKVVTKTTLNSFRKGEMSVKRRFSDFLGLHEKLAVKHLAHGVIIPPAPEKSVVGTTRIKMTKEDTSGNDFIERRRASLERYLNRLARHEKLVVDPDFREFLESEADLPRATNTQIFSGASVMKLFKNVGDAVGKITFKMDETDEYFETKQLEIENLDKQLCRLHACFESLIAHRKDLASQTRAFSRSCALLANAEEHTGLARALSHLSETEEKMEQVHSSQAELDLYVVSEVVKDHIALIQAVKETFNERIKLFKLWKDVEVMLSKKREQKVKMELAFKTDKIHMVEQEIKEFEARVERCKQDFEKISEAIKSELENFDIGRVRDFKKMVIKCLEGMVANQEKVIQYWEAFMPEAKQIL